MNNMLPSSDELKNVYVIRNIVNGKFSLYADPPILIANLPNIDYLYAGPSVIFFLFFAPFEFLGFELTSLRAINSVLGILISIPTYFIAQKITGKRIGLISALILAFSPIIVLEQRFTSGFLMTLLGTIAFYFSILAKENEIMKYKTRAWLFFLLAMLAKPNVIVLVPSIAALTCGSLKPKILKNKKRVLLAITIIVVALLFSQNLYSRMDGFFGTFSIDFNSNLSNLYKSFLSPFYYIHAVLILISLGIPLLFLKKNKYNIYIMLALTFGFILSIFSNETNEVYNFLVLFPFMIIIASMGFEFPLKEETVPTIVSCAVAILILYWIVPYDPFFQSIKMIEVPQSLILFCGIVGFIVVVYKIIDHYIKGKKIALFGKRLSISNVISIFILILITLSEINISYLISSRFSNPTVSSLKNVGEWFDANTPENVCIMTNAYFEIPYFARFRRCVAPTSNIADFYDYVLRENLEYLAIVDSSNLRINTYSYLKSFFKYSPLFFEKEIEGKDNDSNRYIILRKTELADPANIYVAGSDYVSSYKSRKETMMGNDSEEILRVMSGGNVTYSIYMPVTLETPWMIWLYAKGNRMATLNADIGGYHTVILNGTNTYIFFQLWSCTIKKGFFNCTFSNIGAGSYYIYYIQFINQFSKESTLEVEGETYTTFNGRVDMRLGGSLWFDNTPSAASNNAYVGIHPESTISWVLNIPYTGTWRIAARVLPEKGRNFDFYIDGEMVSKVMFTAQNIGMWEWTNLFNGNIEEGIHILTIKASKDTMIVFLDEIILERVLEQLVAPTGPQDSISSVNLNDKI